MTDWSSTLDSGVKSVTSDDKVRWRSSPPIRTIETLPNGGLDLLLRLWSEVCVAYDRGHVVEVRVRVEVRARV